MRIALVIGSLEIGGAQRVLTMLAGAWADRGDNILVVTLDHTEGDAFDLHPEVARTGLGLAGRVPGPLGSLRGNLARVRALRERLSDFGPAVAVSFIHTTNVLTLLACRPLDTTVVVSERNHPAHDRPKAAWRLLRRLTYPDADAVVVQTRPIRRWFARFVPDGRLHIVPNPVEAPPGDRSGEGEAARPEAPPDLPRPAVLAMGRLVRQKGFDLLLDAFDAAASDRPAWHLVVLGEGPAREALERRVSEMGTGDRVHLAGVRTDPWPYLRHADLFALSSRYEGFPNALLEAMAAGLPAVSFDCPTGPSAIVEDGDTGLLVPSGDASALARGMGRLMDDADLRERLGGAAAASVRDRFHPKRVLEMWDGVLDRALTGEAGEGRRPSGGGPRPAPGPGPPDETATEGSK